MKTYSVTIRDNHGAIVDTRTVECSENQDPAEMAMDEAFEDEIPVGAHVSSVEVVS